MISRRSAALLRWVLPLAGLTVLAEIGYPLLHGAARDRLTVVVVLLFAATSVLHAAVSRGARAAGLLLAVLGGGGLLVEAVGTATGVPFGRYEYAAGSLGAGVLGVPLVVPLAWVMMGWPAYLVAALLAGRAGWSGRAARALVGGWALAGWDLFLDPQLVAAGHWRWLAPGPGLPGVPAVPLSNYAGWLVVATALLAGLDAALAAAARPDLARAGLAQPAASGPATGPHTAWAPVRPPAPGPVNPGPVPGPVSPGPVSPGPGEPRPGDHLAYGLYLWTYASSVLGHAAFFGLPASALWGGLGMGIVAVPLALALRRPVPVRPVGHR